MSGAIFYGAAFGWDTLVVDYLWFALIIGVFLGGTLTIGMSRVEAALEAGETADFGWPGPGPLFVFAAWVAGVFILISMANIDQLWSDSAGLQVNIDLLQTATDFDNLESMAGDAGPGVPALVAYLDAKLLAELDDVMRGLTIVSHVLLAWLLYDLGREITDREGVGWAGFGMALVPLAGFQFAVVVVLAGVFASGFWLFSLRWARHGIAFDGFAAAVCAAAAVLVQPLTVVAMGAMYLVNAWLLNVEPVDAPNSGEIQRLPYRFWLHGLWGLPLLVGLGLGPWLISL
jgi:hypothetical protein